MIVLYVKQSMFLTGISCVSSCLHVRFGKLDATRRDWTGSYAPYFVLKLTSFDSIHTNHPDIVKIKHNVTLHYMLLRQWGELVPVNALCVLPHSGLQVLTCFLDILCWLLNALKAVDDSAAYGLGQHFNIDTLLQYGKKNMIFFVSTHTLKFWFLIFGFPGDLKKCLGCMHCRTSHGGIKQKNYHNSPNVQPYISYFPSRLKFTKRHPLPIFFKTIESVLSLL